MTNICKRCMREFPESDVSYRDIYCPECHDWKVLDDKWHTCKHCGKKNGEEKHNYVMNGICRKCDEKITNSIDFKNAQIDGTVRRDNDIMCPYCGDVVEDDIYEFTNNETFTCYNCDKKSKLSVEHTLHFITTKIEEK